MSRFNYRGGRHSGRGRGRDKARIPKQATSVKDKPSADKYRFQIAKDPGDFDRIKAHLILRIRNEFTFGNDIGDALETGTEFDFDKELPTKPKRSISLKKDDAAYEDELNLYVYRSEVQEHVKRKNTYASNKRVAQAFFFQHCSEALRSKLELRKDYVSTLSSDPIKFIDAIKQEVQSFTDTRYPMEVVLTSMRTLINLRQRDDDTLHTYMERFRSARETMESQMGTPTGHP